jgi:hypothetical protein
LTDATPTVIIDSPTLESPERWSLHTDGRVVPSAWRATYAMKAVRPNQSDDAMAIAVALRDLTDAAVGSPVSS